MATLADDSVPVTHFGADPDKLFDPIVPTSSQSMGERTFLMPQELNPDITPKEIKRPLDDLAGDDNVCNFKCLSSTRLSVLTSCFFS